MAMGSNAVFLLSGLWLADVLDSFALVQFTTLTASSLARALVWEPSAMLALRSAGRSPATGLLASAAMAVSATAVAFLALSLGQPLLLFLAVFPAIQDGLRFIAFSIGRLTAVLSSDLAWLVLGVACLGAVAYGWSPTAAQLYALWALSGGVSALLLLVQIFPDARRISGIRLQAAVRRGRYQVVAATLAVAGPWAVIVLALAFDPGAPIGGVRIAQTLLAPIGVVMESRLVMILSWPHATREERLQQLAGLGERKMLLAIAAGYGLTVTAATAVLAGHFAALAQTSAALPILVFGRVIGSQAVPLEVLLRSTGQTRELLVGRAILFSLVLVSALVVSATIGGVFALTVPFVVEAVAARPTWSRILRR